MLKENSDFWDKKRNYNKAHDEEITKLLTSKGWKVVRIWECELKNKNRELLIDKIKELIV